MSDDPPPSSPDQKAPPSPPAAQSSAARNESIEFNKNIRLFLSQPLPQYNRGPIKAFKAEGDGKAPKSLIAFLCDPSLVPRWNAAGSYALINNSNIAHLIATGAAFWPPDKCEKFIMVYENNWGEPLLPRQTKLAFGIKQDIIMDQFLPAMVSALKDMNEKGFVHGGIRVENLFNGNSNQFKNFVLGDSLTTPASYQQPSIYEPIERAMASPIARGMGHFVDDLYSFAVLLAIMIRTHDPLEGLTDREIIEEKIEKSSYAALIGKDRFTGAILELLRGLLHDDKSQRWTIENVMIWMEGQRLSPKQGLKRKKSPRVFHMDGERFSRPELIALHIPEQVNNVTQLIEDQKLELWLERSLEDKVALERLETAVSTAVGPGINETYKYRLASRISIALDPSAPIRYKNLCVHPDGIGNALAEAFAEQSDLSAFAEIIEQGIVMYWLNSQNDHTMDYGSISNRFEVCRTILKNKSLGFGLERCLYFLNPEAPCYSSKLRQYFVKSPEEMVLAFEQLAEKNQMNSLPLDRHAIAFLSAKDSRILDSFLIELNASEKYKNILANVWAIANIQKRFELPPLPHLAEYLVRVMGPVLERFHDRHLRERLVKEFDKIKKSGDLSKLMALLENVEIMDKDIRFFQRAMVQYKEFESEKRLLTAHLEKKGELGKSSGRMAAAIISCALGGLGIITLALIELSGKGTF
ncbi:MAG: hypothetical protein H6857_05000 [Rhodospirillales bacterium]|nr:hypothetical protein [Rhodospirillales bacterium]